jgi:clan AA aspartic protease
MTGTVSADLEAVLRLTVLGPSGQSADIDGVIDTGFSGYLTLPAATIALLGLTSRGPAYAMLADGTSVTLATYIATVLWHGAHRIVIVMCAEADPLIGAALLHRSRVTLDMEVGGAVIIAPLP